MGAASGIRFDAWRPSVALSTSLLIPNHHTEVNDD
jgi:hypothetical protein